jgi:phosphoribosylaminoimidazolecarboxamide formyltransferase/IMP cyclohydrolase
MVHQILAIVKIFAAKAFAMSSHYDSAIFNYFNQTEQLPILKASLDNGSYIKIRRKSSSKRGVLWQFEMLCLTN